MTGPDSSGPYERGRIPARAGIGLRAPHYEEVLNTAPPLHWVEVHSENHFSAGGPQLKVLERVRELYPLSLHGVGLSIGGTDEPDVRHLAALKRLIARFEPGLVSEHLCWCGVDELHLNDLLPLPYTEEALAHVCARVACIQDSLGQRILLENVSSYLQFACSTIPEWEFLAAVSRKTGCGILLDVNNIYVSARNLGFNPYDYLVGIPADHVEEIHLAGHGSNVVDGREILIDTHGAAVAPAVWALYADAVRLFGSVPTLIEWDTDLPSLKVLQSEARYAEAVRDSVYAIAA